MGLREPFQTWVERVFEILHRQLGGKPAQDGPDRRYGDGLFTAAAAYKPEGDEGAVLFQLRWVGGRTFRQVGPFLRDGSVSNGAVADALIEAYNALAPILAARVVRSVRQT